ncbi:MAG: glycosyltransferase family 9 protein [Bdellovibrionota bacterium]
MIKNILLVQLRQLGDILLTTPCTRELKKEFPDSNLFFLSHKMGKLILDDCPFIDGHFIYDPASSLKEQWKLIRLLRGLRIDIAFDFMNNPRSALYTYLSGARKRYSFISSRKIFYTDTIIRGSVDEYIVKEKFKLLQAAGMAPKCEKLVLAWGSEDLSPLSSFLETDSTFRDAHLRIVLSPTHRRARRKWAKENYVKLADYLVRNWGAAVTWLWGPGELDEVTALQKACHEKTMISPKTTFKELAALIGNADLFIGNSNGPSHVAVANDICSLQLHGHTNMKSWCPLNDRHRAIQSSEYGQKLATLDSVTLENVIEVLNDFKPYVENYAGCRKKAGTRISWQQNIS